MNAVIMGCGRVGAAVAVRLDEEGHDVAVIDVDAMQFRRLPSEFRGHKLTGSGFDHRVLEAAGIADADAFLALSHGDNRNVLAAQIARHLYVVQTVIARLYDPFRAELFQRLGLRTFNPTNIGADLAYGALAEAIEASPPREQAAPQAAEK